MYKNFRDYLNERITSGIFTNETKKFVPSNYVELREKIRSGHFRLDEIELPKELDSLSGLFEDRDEISKKGLETWDVSNVSKINHLFRDCVSFTGKEIENWNVKNIEEVSNTFEGCKKFDADLSNWKLRKVKNFTGTFEGCSSFTGKGLDKWNVSKVVYMNLLF